MKEPRALSMGERWRRIATSDVDDQQLERALASLPSIRSPRTRIAPGAIQAELEGAMGALHEVSIQSPPLPTRIWPQVARVLRRSSSMLDALKHGLVPRAFDRLIARVAGEAMFPEPRRVTSACTCSDVDRPCRHILALHELFARQLEDKPWELLNFRGVPLRNLLEQAAKPPEGGDLPPLSFGAKEEPVLFPEGQQGELDSPLTDGEIRALLGSSQRAKLEIVAKAIDDYANAPPPASEVTDVGDAAE